MKFYVWISGFLLMIYIAGCAPRLAQTPLSEEESRWQQFIKQNYPEWRPPQTVPPSVAMQSPKVSIDDSDRFGVSQQPTLIEDNSFSDKTVIDTTPITPLNAPPAPTEATDGRSFETYTVQKNDTLWQIAVKFYQKGSLWTRIQEANPDLENVNKIKVGTELRIPLP